MDTNDLTSIIKTNNETPCENHFWSNPIDNSTEIVGLLNQTSWSVKSRYISKPLNKIPNVIVTNTKNSEVICDESSRKEKNKQEDKKEKSKVVEESSNYCSLYERKKQLSETQKANNRERKQNFKKLTKKDTILGNKRIIMSRIKIVSILLLHLILKIEHLTNH